MNLVLESDRLLLRPLSENDLDVSIAILTDPAVMRYVAETRTEEQVIQEHPATLNRFAGGCVGFWCVIDRRTNEKLGTALLQPLPIDVKGTPWNLVGGEELPDGEVEVGYFLKRSAWGKGYATEACLRLLKFVFEETQLPEIVAITAPGHTASRKVLMKSGLIAEGMRRAYAGQRPGFRITRQQWLDKNQVAS